MKLVTPPLIVEENDSFKNDALGRKSYGEALLNLVVRTSDPLVISLDGKWGEGKTTFVKMWQGLLSESNIPNIYIDAFENDYVDDAFISVASAITNYAEVHIETEHHDKYLELKEKTKKVGGQILSWSTRIGIKAATLGIIKDADLQELKEIRGDLSKSVSDVVGDFIEERISSHSQDIELIRSFRDVLSALPSKLKGESDNPLVIIIDELDRCKPTFSVEIVEKIKHLFSVKNVVFLLVMNKVQLEESIRSVYGQKIDAYTYLQKFVNLEAKLPKRTSERYTNDYSKYAKRLLKLHELETWGDDTRIIDHIEPLANHFNLSLRQLEKIFTNLTVFYGLSAKDDFRSVPIIVFLAVIKVIDPQLFDEILEQRSSYDETIKKLNLPNLDKESEQNSVLFRLMQWARFALVSEEEFNELQKVDTFENYGGFLWPYNLTRESLFPFFAQKFSIFVVTE